MPHQLMCERSTHALEKKCVVRVLEDGAVSLFLDVVEILARGPLRWIVLAHVAHAPRELRELLSISALAKKVDRKVRGHRKARPSEKRDRGLEVEMRHGEE